MGDPRRIKCRMEQDNAIAMFRADARYIHMYRVPSSKQLNLESNVAPWLATTTSLTTTDTTFTTW